MLFTYLKTTVLFDSARAPSSGNRGYSPDESKFLWKSRVLVVYFCSPFRSERVTNDYDEEAADSMGTCGAGRNLFFLRCWVYSKELAVTDGERVLRKASVSSLEHKPLCSARTSRIELSKILRFSNLLRFSLKCRSEKKENACTTCL